MSVIQIRFHEDLIRLLPPSSRVQPVVLDWTGRASVMDLIESLGVPHTEVGAIRIGGAPADRSQLVHPGDVIEVDPPPAGSFPGRRGVPARDRPAEPRFALDVHLGKLSALLRLLGFDTLYRNDWDDPELARIADAEDRILLTRDRQLLKRRMVRMGYCVREDRPREQAREILDRFRLRGSVRIWARCLRCNGLISPVETSEVWELLEPKTKLYYDQFYRCLSCGQVYWEGSHHRALLAALADLGCSVPQERR